MRYKEQLTPENRDKISISKLHFLIHPGYTIDPNSDEEDFSYKNETTESLENLDNYSLLSNRYFKAAEQIASKPGEILILFTHHSGKFFRNEYKYPKDYENAALYTSLIAELKEILGNRLVVLSGDFPMGHRNEEIVRQNWKKVLEILQARGFTLDDSVQTEAFGEYMESCVKASAVTLNKVAGFKSKTAIKPLQSEVGMKHTEFDLKTVKKALKKGKETDDDNFIDYKF